MSFLRFFAIVPEKWVYVIERFGKFHKIMNAGLGMMVPVADSIAYRHSLKE
jgi:regulator of protease activity HflC (stomatin/prohibitin superfamily)